MWGAVALILFLRATAAAGGLCQFAGAESRELRRSNTPPPAAWSVEDTLSTSNNGPNIVRPRVLLPRHM
jgi:hypothetical protein